MADLRALYGELGFAKVSTYIQSGNVIFESSRTGEPALVSRLEKAIGEKFGFPVTVILRSLDAWRQIARRHPLSAGADPKHLHVACLARRPGAAAVRALGALDTKGDRFTLEGREVFLHCPGGYARSALTNSVLEKKLGLAATTRNWRTVGKLLEMAEEATG